MIYKTHTHACTHAHLHACTHARTHTHTHTHTQLRENKEIEAGGLKVVFEQVFYEDSFKRGSRTGSS